jgi:hypothetical protein
MLQPTEQAVVDKGWPALWLISVSMFVSVAVYAVVCYYLAGMPFIPVSNAPVELITHIFAFLSALALVLTYFLRKTMLSGKSASPSAPSRATAPFFGQYMTVVIVSEAISETIAIFGLILLFLGAGLLTAYAFIAVSALSMFVFRPNRDELEQFASRIRQGSIAME